MKKKIFYVSEDIARPDTSMNIFALNRGRLFNLSGYDVTYFSIACKNTDKNSFCNFKYHLVKKRFDSPHIISVLEDIWQQINGNRLFSLVKKEIEKDCPDLVILYGYQAENKLMRYCKKHKIPFVLERTDWFERDDVDSKVVKYLHIPLKERAINHDDLNASGIITVSQYMADHYRQYGIPVLVIPTISNGGENKDLDSICCNKNEKLNLIYAGACGKKDLIVPAIKAVEKINKDTIKIQLDILGDIPQNIVSLFPIDEYSKKGIIFHGKCSHEVVLEYLRRADFSLLLRHNKKYAKAGFSTKVSESMFEAVPVICTNVGGTDSVITHMYDGIKVKDNGVDTLINTFQDLINLSTDRLREIKINAYHTANKKFSIDTYVPQFKEFVECLIK